MLWWDTRAIESPPKAQRSLPPIAGEISAPPEFARLLFSRIYLGIGVPRGPGRRVLARPGFMGNDDYLLPLCG